MFALAPELNKFAKENCNESLEIQEKQLACLKAWLKQTPHLKSRTNDELLLSFLRYCRYNLLETKKRIDAFYSMKIVFPEVLTNRLLHSPLMELYNQGIHTLPIKPLNTNGSRIIISQYNKYDPKATTAGDVFKLLVILLEILANEDPNASVFGVSYVIDARDVSVEQMLQYNPDLLKKLWIVVQNCLPIRFREIHLINMRKEGQEIFKFVTSFLPSIMPIKFIVHEKAEDLFGHLPRESMTVEYGGNNGYQQEALKHWGNIILKYKDYFADDDKYGTKEKLRAGLTVNPKISELTGTSGLFRKLNVD